MAVLGRRILLLAVLAVPLALATGCATASAKPAADEGPARTVRLGYFANVTHAAPIVAVAKGFDAKRLGATKLQTQIFNAGPAAVEALFAGSIDAAYVGPNPAINAFTRSDGKAVRIVAGAASGGAALVVQPDITSASQLRGKTLADPQLGGTQDVALRSWLKQQGLNTSISGKGDVTVLSQENATTLDLFKKHEIDGAWVPEPWASRLVLTGGGRVLVDEKTLWPAGKFVTTHLLVTTKFLEQHPETVRALIEGEADAVGWINAHPNDAQATVNSELERLTGKALKPEVIKRAFGNIDITLDPVAASLRADADHAKAVGLLSNTELAGIYDLRLLNDVLRSRGRPAVAADGLGKA